MHDPASSSSAPARRSRWGGERASSFGFDFAAREALARREPDSVAKLFDVAFERIHAYLSRMAQDQHLAEDLTQETFLRLQRGLATYRPERDLRPWVFTVASNVLRDHFAARRERVLDVMELAGGDAEPRSRADAPSARLALSEQAHATSKALAELSDQARAVVVLRHYESLSFAEIAAALSTSEDTARQRYVRALARLRVRLAALSPDLGEPA